MANKESLFASLHILMRAIPDGPADAGRKLHRYWYRESRYQVRTGWQIQNPRKSAQSVVNERFFVILCLSGKKQCRLSSAPLHLSRTLYKFTLFMQNKPNLLDAQMNVSSLITVDYENKSNWKLGKNKANTKPIRANLLDAQMNVSAVLTSNYNNEQRTMNYAKQTQSNPTCSELACGEQGRTYFKRGTYAALRSVVLTEDKFRRGDNLPQE